MNVGFAGVLFAIALVWAIAMWRIVRTKPPVLRGERLRQAAAAFGVPRKPGESEADWCDRVLMAIRPREPRP